MEKNVNEEHIHIKISTFSKRNSLSYVLSVLTEIILKAWFKNDKQWGKKWRQRYDPSISTPFSDTEMNSYYIIHRTNH